MKAILYGVSVGPGDPELMTLKAVKIINSCEVLAVPRTKGENTLALDIAAKSCSISEKEILYLDFVMTNNSELLEHQHDIIANKLCTYLESGKNIAFLNIGDISVYSTFSYIASIINDRGFVSEMCPGVTSFCAAASAINIPLVQGNESLVILPASCMEFDSLISSSGTIVIMKSGRELCRIKSKLPENSYAVCNCGLEHERIYKNKASIPDNCGYFTTIIFKKQGKD